ncbi:hypothetical protein CMEL01_02503, partial [Colletotrichum melonis]
SSRENRAPKYGNTYLVNNGVSQRSLTACRLVIVVVVVPSGWPRFLNGIADWLVISRNGPRGTLKVKYLGSCTLGPWSRLHTRPTSTVRTFRG